MYNPEFIQSPEELDIYTIQSDLKSSKNTQRGQASFFELNGLPSVFKHYYRGGLVAKVNQDKYLWTGLTNTRVYKEWELLDSMAILKLPVPVPIAARIKRHGLFYSTDLITQRIMNAKPFGEILKTISVDTSVWEILGKLIQTFHRHGIYHADLNANNILMTHENDLYLIDFDKSRMRMKSVTWMNKVIHRLQRSFNKIKSSHPGYHYSPENWQALMRGYHS